MPSILTTKIGVKFLNSIVLHHSICDSTVVYVVYMPMIYHFRIIACIILYVTSSEKTSNFQKLSK